LSDKSDKSDKSDTSATPTHPAYHRCHQTGKHTPPAHFRPSHTKQRPRKPTGYHMACHGVARQGEDGRTHHVRQVRQVRQVRHKRHAPAPRIPPLPSNRQAYPTGTFAPEPNLTAAPQALGVSHGLPRRSPSGRRRAHPSCQTSQTSQTSQTQAPRPRTPHTAVAIKQALHTPAVNLYPSPSRQRHSKPSGYTAAHHYPFVTVNHRLLPFLCRPRNTLSVVAVFSSKKRVKKQVVQC